MFNTFIEQIGGLNEIRGYCLVVIQDNISENDLI